MFHIKQGDLLNVVKGNSADSGRIGRFLTNNWTYIALDINEKNFVNIEKGDVLLLLKSVYRRKQGYTFICMHKEKIIKISIVEPSEYFILCS